MSARQNESTFFIHDKACCMMLPCLVTVECVWLAKLDDNHTLRNPGDYRFPSWGTLRKWLMSSWLLSLIL
jgi:hypothetical protein